MRLVIGFVEGHGFAFDVSTFERLKSYCLMCVRDENVGGTYDILIKRLNDAQTEEDLLSDEIIDSFCDMEYSPFQHRNMFTEISDPPGFGK